MTEVDFHRGIFLSHEERRRLGKAAQKAMQSLGEPESNPNRCAACLLQGSLSAEYMDYDLADSGVCGNCLESVDVWDTELLAAYQDQGITLLEISRHLPRLRVSGTQEKNP